jgi:hypothetical protein
MSDSIKKAALPACFPELGGHLLLARRTGDQVTHIDDRDMGKILRSIHDTTP